MHNAVMCTLSLSDVIRITRHLHIKLKSFSNIAQSLHKEAVRSCSLLYIVAKKSVIMSEAFLSDVSIDKYICILFILSKHIKFIMHHLRTHLYVPGVQNHVC